MYRWALSVRNPVHGFLDVVSVVNQMSRWEDMTNEAARRLGFAHGHLPRSPFASFLQMSADTVEALAAEASGWYEEYYEGRFPRRIWVRPASLMGRWWDYLEPLDAKGKVSPWFWVPRESLAPAREPAWLDERPRVGLWAIEPTLDVDKTEYEEDLRYGWPAGIDHNPWWHWDVMRARRLLSSMSPSDLERELGSGQRLLRAGEQTPRFWEYDEVMRPVTYISVKKRGRFPMPELKAIPFYQTQDVKKAFEAILDSYLSLSLLEDVSDNTIASKRLVAKARENLELPATEKRGRPKGRSHSLVVKVGKMVHEERLPKYQVHKRLGMPRTTVSDYLKEYERSLKAGE